MHPPGWLVGLENQQKRSPQNRGFFCRQEFRIFHHAGVTGAGWRHLNDLLLSLEIPVQAVEGTGTFY